MRALLLTVLLLVSTIFTVCSLKTRSLPLQTGRFGT